jgi:hypothetical protein
VSRMSLLSENNFEMNSKLFVNCFMLLNDIWHGIAVILKITCERNIICSVQSLIRKYQHWIHISYNSHYTVKLLSCLDMILHAHIFIHCSNFDLNYVSETGLCVCPQVKSLQFILLRQFLISG